MKSRFSGFVWILLGMSLLMVLFLSPLASSSPDGLEKVAQAKGFSQKGEQWRLWGHAPFRDYAIPWIRHEKVSTALSGVIGAAAIFMLVLAFGKLVGKRTEP